MASLLSAMEAGDGARPGSTALARAQTYAVDRGELVAVSVPGWQARLDQAREQGKLRPSARDLDRVEVASVVAVARMTHGQGADQVVGHSSLRTRLWSPPMLTPGRRASSARAAEREMPIPAEPGWLEISFPFRAVAPA